MKRRAIPLKVVAAVRMCNAASRQNLRGIYRFAAGDCDWDIELVRSEHAFTAETVGRMVRGGAEGFIVNFSADADAFKALEASGVPFVARCPEAFAERQDYGRRFASFPCDDDTKVGEIAAAHFLSLGRFSAFGYVPDQDASHWSRGRERGFRDSLSLRTATFSVFPGKGAALADWLESLPKPAAVFAAWDVCAADVVSACRTAGLRVPAEVAVLGVDDDEFVCDSVHPKLSSVRIDRECRGYEAAAMLHAMMRGRDARRVRIERAAGPSVVIRESTAPVAPASMLVETAETYIAENTAGGLTPDAVAAHMRVSRRLLDLRFREFRHVGVAELIRRRRLDEAKRLLRATKYSEAKIAALCGFANPDSMRNLFRNRIGLSMRAYRGQK